jgi:hypothetical protein
MYDSVYVFAQGLAALDRGHILKPANLSCELEQPWNDGLSLYNYINSVSNCRTSHMPFAVHQRVGVNTMSVLGFEFQPRPNSWTQKIFRSPQVISERNSRLKYDTTIFPRGPISLPHFLPISSVSTGKPIHSCLVIRLRYTITSRKDRQ